MSDNYLMLRQSNGTVIRFFPLDNSPLAGKLASIRDKCGNLMIFEYDAATGWLTRTLDTYGRPIVYEHDTIGHITKVRDFYGREVIFTYDANNDLVSVRSPLVEGTPNGNDFPAGKTLEFTYSSGFSDFHLNHNMLSITAPNETAVEGDPYIVNYYDASEDRLISQDWGGTNSSGVSAGGNVSFARTTVNEGVDEANPDLPRVIITSVDRNGNETIFWINNGKHVIRKEEKTRGIRPGDPASFVTTYKYSLATGLLTETILPQGNRVAREYAETSADQFQQGQLLSITHYPDSRGGEQAFIRFTYQYEPVYNQIWKVTEERGNDPSYVPQNGGSTSAARYTTENVPDYFEGDLDTPGCACGHTLREIAEMWDIDLTAVLPYLNQGDINGDGQYNICGNTIVTRYPAVKIRPDSPQAVVEGSTAQIMEKRTSYTRNGQLDWEETPEGEITRYYYYAENDPDGDGQNILTGNNPNGQPYNALTGGWLKQVIVDESHSVRYRGTTLPAQISVEMGYDPVGNILWALDPRGVRTDLVVNQINQVVEIHQASDVSRATEPGLAAYNYKGRIYYDYNNNVVKTESEYRDGNNTALPAWLTTTYTYDILDNVLEITSTVDNGQTVITQFRYDANENLIETISPLAVAGIEPANRIIAVYDERDLVCQIKAAPGTPEESTVTYRYDLNGNAVEIRDSEDNSGDGLSEFVTIYYDGFDRNVSIVDAAGNEVKLFYDPDSNVVRSEVWGPVGGPTRISNSTAGNVLLARGFGYYDEISRLYQSESELFLPQGVSFIRAPLLSEGDKNPGDGRVTSFIDYDRNSRITFATAASPATALEVSKFIYDGLGRVIKAEDVDGDQVLTQYDKNSNTVAITATEKHPTGRVPQETFVTRNVFDSLNRVIRTTDNIGQTRRFYYDSRSLLIRATDAQGATIPDPLGLYPGSINADGNAAEFIHDGLGRSLRTLREMTVDGQGGSPLDLSNPANPDGRIVEESAWDVNSRIVYVRDDKGNSTSYQYDSLNRPVRTTFADGTTNSVVFDRDSNPRQFTDNNGTIVTNTFDGLNRLVRKTLTRAPGVTGTTAQTFEYDGLSRITRATDDNNPQDSSDDSLVERRYDSFSRLLEETQNGKVVSFNWTQGLDPVDQTYPNGRKIRFTLDRLNRLTAITDASGGQIAGYDYLASRVIERTYGNGVRLSMLNDAGNETAGYDNLGRLTQMRHLKGSTPVAGYSYGYNRENIKLYSENLMQPGLSELYRYDSTYRLTDFERGTLTAGKDAIAGTPSQTQTWRLDGVGNWALTTVDGAANTPTVNQMNEYDVFSGVAQAHDDNGNMTDDGKYALSFDFANRITEVRNKQDNALVARYTYDSFNRRTSKYFTRTREEEGPGGEGEYRTDPDTIGLWHFNETSGQVQDSSGLGNHGRAPRHIKRGVDGLWDTKAVEFCGIPIEIDRPKGLDRAQNAMTVETWVYIDTPECKCKKPVKCAHGKTGKCPKCEKESKQCKCGKCKKHKGKCHRRPFCPLCWGKWWQGGSLIHRPGIFQLEVRRHDRRAEFTLHLEKPKQGRRCPPPAKVVLQSDTPLPLDEWVHLAAVYDGTTVKLYVDTVVQEEKQATGTVLQAGHRIPLFLGGMAFFGKLEEARISCVARTSFGGGNGGPVIVRENVLRGMWWAGWRLIEERERVAPEGGELGVEKVTRQYCDGLGIDEHLCTWIYGEDGTTVAQTRYYHENHRGDTVALTDEQGNVVLRCEYSAYGVPYEVNAQGVLQPFKDAELLRYGFQGREIDAETGWYQFRNRYYSAQQGRFLSRDPLGYAGGGMGLFEAFAASPYVWLDSWGKWIFSIENGEFFAKSEAGDTIQSLAELLGYTGEIKQSTTIFAGIKINLTASNSFMGIDLRYLLPPELQAMLANTRERLAELKRQVPEGADIIVIGEYYVVYLKDGRMEIQFIYPYGGRVVNGSIVFSKWVGGAAASSLAVPPNCYTFVEEYLQFHCPPITGLTQSEFLEDIKKNNFSLLIQNLQLKDKMKLKKGDILHFRGRTQADSGHGAVVFAVDPKRNRVWVLDRFSKGGQIAVRELNNLSSTNIGREIDVYRQQ